jgi:hypothetical protein
MQLNSISYRLRGLGLPEAIVDEFSLEFTVGIATPSSA